jgi:glycosyltransferase involved in cell wall biosynthesis
VQQAGNSIKISVLIPAYNCGATLRETLDSVLAQTHAPHEILVMDDGSTDETSSILDSYKPRITAFRQTNTGAGEARNALILQAQGELVAFLDPADIWHPRYLEVQAQLFHAHPQAVAVFTSHSTFYGEGEITWTCKPFDLPRTVEVIEPPAFLRQYNETPEYFNPSFCCVPRQVLRAMGDQPFRGRIAEECYFFNFLSLFGPVVRASTSLVVYRIRERSLLSDPVKLREGTVRSFELLEEHFKKCFDMRIYHAFEQAVASRRRDYAKALLGVCQVSEARKQLRKSLRSGQSLLSAAKSLRSLSLSYLPRALQPNWRVGARTPRDPISS